MPMTDAEDEVVWQAAVALDYINRWRNISIVVGTIDTWIYDDSANAVLSRGATMIQAIRTLQFKHPSGREATP